ncbi:MAG: hypothetical protein Q9187_004710 [Circinaria calcarea]
MSASIPPGVDLSKIPLERNPAVKSNFVDPPTLAPAVTGVGIIMTIITVVFVLMRLNANLRSARKIGWDDCFCVLALLLSLTYTGVVISLNTTARHPWDVPLSVFADPSYSKRIFVLGMTFGPGIWFAKAAILMLYLRVFQVKRIIRFLIYFGLTFMFVLYWISVPLFSYYCTPRAGEAWDLTLLGKCHVNAKLALVQGVFGVVADIYIFILPLPTIYNLNLAYKKKVGLAAIFMTGILGIIASALSLYFRVLNWEHKDSTWNSAKVYIFVFVETYVTIIVGCTPAVASFGRNTMTKSALFQSLRSFLSTSLLRLTGKEDSIAAEVYSGQNNHDPESLSHLKEGDIDELNAPRQMAYSTVTSDGKYAADGPPFITRIVSLDQWSEGGRTSGSS